MGTLTRTVEDHYPPIRNNGYKSNKNFALGGSANMDLSGSTGTFNSPSGTSTFNGPLTVAAGQVFTVGTGGLTAAMAAITGNNVNWALGGSPASGSHGNNTTMVAGTTYWVQGFVEANQTLTGISVLVGGTGGTDKWIVALYDYQGNLLANSALTGTNVSATANTQQSIAFTATYNAIGPAYVFMALQSNGTTAKFQSYTTPGAAYVASSATGSFGTLPSPLTPGSSYTNATGPVCSTY